jgi:hypothetical protein
MHTLVERVYMNFKEKLLTYAVFLDVAKDFSTLLADGFLYKPTVLNFPSYLVKTISSYLHGQSNEASFQTTTPTCCFMGVGVAPVGIIYPAPCSLYVNDMPTPSCHADLS